MQNLGSRDSFFEGQSNQLRDNYKKAITNNQQSDSNPSQQKAQFILKLIMFSYTVILIAFVLLLYWDQDFRLVCYEVLKNLSEQGQFLGALYIGIIGYIFVLTGFNVVMYDILAGFLIKPFLVSLLVVSIAKTLAKYTGFLIGRYKLRNLIYIAMNQNLSFITCYLAAERKPLKVMYLIQFLAIPTIFKTYACGLFRISHNEFIVPTIFGTVTWAAFWVYLGANLESLNDVLNSGDTDAYVPIWLKGTLVVIIILIIIYFARLTNQIYDEIHQEAHLPKLNEIIENEKNDEENAFLTPEQVVEENIDNCIEPQENQLQNKI